MKFIFKYKYIILAIIVGFVVFGVIATIKIPKQEMPSLQTPYQIITATEIEENGTDLSDCLETWRDHEDIVSLRTITYPISTLIIVELSYDTAEPDTLKANLFSDLEAKLPNYELVEREVVASYDLIFAVIGDTSSLNTVASDLVSEIEKLPTEDTAIHIEYNESIYILFSPDQMLLNNVSVEDLNTVMYLINQADIDNLEALSSLVISEGVTLEDIATISVESTPNASFNGEPAIFVQSSFEDGIDYTQYIEDIENIVDDLNTEYENNTVTPIVMTPKDVDVLFTDLIQSVLLAVLVVFIVSVIGLGFKQSLIVVAIVPATIFITILALYYLGFELHKLTIIGLILSIGMMVDNAIVLTEGTKTFIEMGYTSKEAASLAIRKNKWPILTATLTTLIAFSSIVFIPGFIGDLIMSMPISVIIAIGASYCLSLILTPILASMFIHKGKSEKNTSLIFENMIDRTIRHSKKIVLLVVVLVVSILFYSLYKVDINLFPSDEKNDFYISVSSENNNDLEDAVNTLYEQLDEYDSIQGISISINTDLPRFHLSSKALSYDQYSARIYVNYSDSNTSMMELIDTVNTWEIDNVSFQAASMYLSPPDAPLEVFFTGEGSSAQAALIYQELLDNESIESMQITNNQDMPIPVVMPIGEYDNQTLMMLNGLVQQQVNSPLIIDNKELIVTYGLGISESLSMVSLNSTSQFYQTYSLDTTEIDYSIHEYNLEESAYLSITPFANNDITSIKDEINGLISEDITVSYSGETNLFLTLSKSLIVSAGVAVLLMFLLLWFQFKKLVYPLIIMVTIPLSFTGSLLGMKLFNYDITISSLIGMVSLLGVTINIGILLIEEIISKSCYHSIKNACIRGTAQRLRPILLTSLTTILGLIPLYITGGDFFKPLAITFIFGMIFATLVSLFIIPVMVFLIQSVKNKNVT